jgi:hypothetical protein
MGWDWPLSNPLLKDMAGRSVWKVKWTRELVSPLPCRWFNKRYPQYFIRESNSNQKVRKYKEKK